MLEDKDLWGFVTGEETEPKGPPEAITAFNKRQRKALSTVCLQLRDAQLRQIQTAKNVQSAWKTLEGLYQTKSLANRLYLRRKLYSIQMHTGDSMANHINRIQSMADQLNSIGEPLNEEDIVMTLLGSLPDKFSTLITALESRSEPLTMEFVGARLLNQELRKSNFVQNSSDQAFFGAVKWPTSAHNSFPIRKTIYCKYCKKPGHLIKDCRKRMFSKKAKSEQANQASTDRDHLFISALCVSTKEDSKTWYIDSGASQHMSNQKEWFSSFQPIPTRKVYLGDDYTLDAIGMVTISINLG